MQGCKRLGYGEERDDRVDQAAGKEVGWCFLEVDRGSIAWLPRGYVAAAASQKVAAAASDSMAAAVAVVQMTAVVAAADGNPWMSMDAAAAEAAPDARIPAVGGLGAAAAPDARIAALLGLAASAQMAVEDFPRQNKHKESCVWM